MANATIQMENVSDTFLQALKAMLKTQNDIKFKIIKEKHQTKEEIEDEILSEVKQMRQDYKEGKLKTFSSAKEMHEDILNG